MPHFQCLVRALWDLLQERRVTIAIRWVASEFNPADLPSRGRWTLSRAVLHETTVDFIMAGFPHIACVVDWVACADTTQFVAEGPQPRVPGVSCLAEGIFAQGDRLCEFSLGWGNLPWHLIPQIVRLLAHSPPGTCAILVCPDLRVRPWRPLFDSLVVGRRRRVP